MTHQQLSSSRKTIAAFAGAAAALCVAAALPTTVSAQVYVQIAPPAPVAEVMPAPPRGMVWVQGHHEWRHGRYLWVPGTWVHARHDNGRGHAYGRQDRDRDGVPDRFDRAPNNPYRR